MSKRVFTAYVDNEKKILSPENVDTFKFILSEYPTGTKVTITVEPFVRPRSLNQSALLHKYLKYISDYTGDDIQSIKTVMKHRYGAINEDGSLKSTALYSTTEMNKLIEGTYIFGSNELSIHMPTPDDLKNKNIK